MSQVRSWLSIAVLLVLGSGPASAFGALAIDSYRGPHYGYSYNYNNIADARARALKECGNNCTVVLTFKNTCAAFAADQTQDNGASGWGYATSKEEAQQTALKFCAQYGGKSCLVRVWACESLVSGDTAKATREGDPPAQVASLPPQQQVTPPQQTVPPQVTPPMTRPAQQGPAASTLPLDLPPADGARRVALVIGNDLYDNLDHLQKAVNDARAIRTALTKLGFEVIEVENAPRRTMNQRIVEFAGKVARGDTAFFFYSGHGVEIKGVNYLLGTDTPGASDNQEALIISEGIPADSIVDQLQDRGARVSMLVLDACRENPFKQAGTRGIGGTRGLAQMALSAEGVFVLYSAGVGQTALDRLSDRDPDPNSVFTRTFSKVLVSPGMTVQDMAKETQTEVRKLAATVNHPQMPAYYDQILGQFTFTQAN
jgi:hypothetical protein